jgi:hypothetical protein
MSQRIAKEYAFANAETIKGKDFILYKIFIENNFSQEI